MSITTFSVRTAREVRRKVCPPVRTTFLTVDGPTVRSIWFDTDGKGRQTFTVTQVARNTVFKNGGEVFKVGAKDDFEELEDFMDKVAIGRYVLAGVEPEQISHVEC